MAAPPFAGDMGMSASLGTAVTTSAPSALQLSGNKRKLQRHVIDPELERQIYKYYYEEEPLIGVCKTQRFALTFVGEMHIEWGGSGAGGADGEAIVLDAPSERVYLEVRFRTALEFRDMFGMVPVLLTRRGAARISNGRPLFWIPPFGAGHFVLQYDQAKMQTTVVYEVPAGVGANRRQPARTLKVFMWPGLEPSIVTRRFRSRVASLMPRYMELTELRANLRDADFRAAHPVVFTQARPDTRSVQEMTEEEVMGLVDEGAPGPDEARRYARNTHRAIQTEALATAINHAARDPFGAGPAPIARGAVDPASRRVVHGTRDQTWDGAIEPLPIGEEMARGVAVPQSRGDIAAHEARYEDLVCKAMGIPAAYISGTGGTQRMRGEADQLRNNVRAAVRQDRADINAFYAWAYEETHRTRDDAVMVRALLAADTTEAAGPDTAERARIAHVRANIARIAAEPFRTRVVFSEDPLPVRSEPQMLAAAVDAHAITRAEHINLLRAELGIPSIDKSHALMRGAPDDAAPPPDDAAPARRPKRPAAGGDSPPPEQQKKKKKKREQKEDAQPPQSEA